MKQPDYTKELFFSLEKRIEEYCLARFARTPEHYWFTEGTLTVVINHGQYCEDEYHTVTPEELTRDLEETANIRLEEERIAREKADALRKEQQARQEEYNKERRRQTYLQLKREFELP